MKYIKYKTHNAKVLDTSVKAYPDSGATYSSLPQSIIAKYKLKPIGYIIGYFLNGYKRKMNLYKAKFTLLGVTKTVTFAGMNKKIDTKPFVYIGRNTLKKFGYKGIKF